MTDAEIEDWLLKVIENNASIVGVDNAEKARKWIHDRVVAYDTLIELGIAISGGRSGI